MAKQETIADIIAEMRDMGNYQRYSGDHARVLASRLDAAHKRERGDFAKLREACANIAEYARSAQCHTEDAHVLGYLNQIEGWAKAALAEPPRQCDIGTADEQANRFQRFCTQHGECMDSDCTCPMLSKPRPCEFAWMQLPYESEVNNGSK